MKKNIEFLELDYGTVITNLDTRKIYVYLYDKIYTDVIIYGLKLTSYKLEDYVALNYELTDDDYFFKLKETTQDPNAKHTEFEIKYSSLVEPYVTGLYNEFVNSEVLELILSLITDILSGERLHNKLMEITMEERTKIDEIEYLETEAEYQDWYDKILEQEKIREIEEWQKSITDERIESLLEYVEDHYSDTYNDYEEKCEETFEELKELTDWQESLTDQKIQALFDEYDHLKSYDLMDHIKEILNENDNIQIDKELQIKEELNNAINIVKKLLF